SRVGSARSASRWLGRVPKRASKMYWAQALNPAWFDVMGSATKVPDFQGVSSAGFATITMVNGFGFLAPFRKTFSTGFFALWREPFFTDFFALAIDPSFKGKGAFMISKP